MDLIGGRRLAVAAQPEVVGDLPQLAHEVLPFPHADVVEELGAAHPSERARRPRPLLGLEVVPEGEHRQEVRVGVGEASVHLVRLGLVVGRPLADVLDRQGGGQDHDLPHAGLVAGLQDHAAEAGIDGQPGQATPHLGQRAVGAHGPQLDQQGDGVADGVGVGRVDERERLDVAEPQRGHLQDDRRQVGAQDLGLGELGPAGEVVLVVEPDADAGRHTAAPTGPLVRRRLADRLDGQPLDLGAAVVARDAGGARVDDVAHAGHGDRRLGHVGGEDDAPPAVGAEGALLLGRRQPGVERQDLGVGELLVGEGGGGVADLALAAEEHEDVARALTPQLVDRGPDAVDLVALEGPVAHLDGVGAAGHLDDGGVEVGGEALGVDGGRGDDQLEVGPPGEEAGEVAEEEVDVQAALVGLVDDDRVVAAQHPVALQLGEQDAVGHELHLGVLADLVGEAHGVADPVAQLGAQLLGDAGRHGAGGQAPGLRVPDERLACRGPARGTSWGAGCSCPNRSRPRPRRPGGRGWRPSRRRAAR